MFCHYILAKVAQRFINQNETSAISQLVILIIKNLIFSYQNN
jgi:hypothetical protein